MKLGFLVPVAGLALLTGCETFYGLKTYAVLAEPPVLECVDSALRGVDGVHDVRHGSGGSRGYQIFPRVGPSVTVSEVWSYDTGPGGVAILQILNDDGHVTYTNGRTRIGSPIPEAELRAYAPVMARVNAAVQQACGLDLGDLNTAG